MLSNLTPTYCLMFFAELEDAETQFNVRFPTSTHDAVLLTSMVKIRSEAGAQWRRPGIGPVQKRAERRSHLRRQLADPTRRKERGPWALFYLVGDEGKSAGGPT